MAKIISTVDGWRKIRRELHEEIGFVPTMGALHEGHLSLCRHSKRDNPITVVSIFVNPTQFNNPEDLKKYPRTFEEDLRMLEAEKVDYIFSPEYQELYADNYRYALAEKELTKILCGAHRPGHFDGVLTVVMKLFNIINPDRAYFGEKDYQQYLLIDQMVKAFFIPIAIVPCPIVREHDGLAMSSRNRLLNKDARQLAPQFYQELAKEQSISQTVKNLEEVGFVIDYIEDHFGRRFGAVTINNVRLIDNVKKNCN